MKKIQMKLYSVLCIISLLLLSVTPVSVPAATTASGSALTEEEARETSSEETAEEEEESGSSSGSALEEDSDTASRGALTLGDIEVTEDIALPRIKRVVLPTITDSTYDFTIDIDGLLSQFKPDYQKGDSVYFSSVLTPAQLKTMSPRHTLVMQTKTAEDGRTKLETALTGKTWEEAMSVFQSGSYYLWQPNVLSITGEGRWMLLQSDNYDIFLEFELDDEEKIAKVLYHDEPFSETPETIWDGKIYTVSYVEISSVKAASQFYQYGTPARLASYSNAELYVKTTDHAGNTFYYPATLTSGEEGSVWYCPAVYTHAGSSVPATITNKSSFDICVTVELQVHNGEWLTFCPSPMFQHLRSRTANMYLAFNANGHIAPVMGDYAAASYILPGINTDAIPYLIISSGENELVTGVRHHYLSPLLSYSSVEFQLEAAIDTRDYVDSAWDSYVDAIVAGVIQKPSINVVYQISEVAKDEENPARYISEHGMAYMIADATDGREDYWVTCVLPWTKQPTGEESKILPRQYYVYLLPQNKKHNLSIV